MERLRVPRGPAQPWSEEELDALATLSRDDVEDARVLWHELAEPEFRGLIDTPAAPVKGASGARTAKRRR